MSRLLILIMSLLAAPRLAAMSAPGAAPFAAKADRAPLAAVKLSPRLDSLRAMTRLFSAEAERLRAGNEAQREQLQARVERMTADLAEARSISPETANRLNEMARRMAEAEARAPETADRLGEMAERTAETLEIDPEVMARIREMAESGHASRSDDPQAIESPASRAAEAEAARPTTVRAADAPDVAYSFDHYATNSKMERSFISESMLQAMARAGKLNFSHWNVTALAPRLTSVLSLHTHSRSTTKLVRADVQKVVARKKYDCVLQTSQGDVEIYVYARRRRKVIAELIIFRFRSDYCSRVFQLTGSMKDGDVAALMKLRD